jgi:ribosome-interacting GTPase 1
VARFLAWQYSLTVSQCHSIHKTIVEDFKHAIVYGKSVKHQPQRVGLSHVLADEDIGTYLVPMRVS